MILLVKDNESSKVDLVKESSFVNLKIWERKDLQEWIRRNPKILGEDLLIVSIEFNQFNETKDRLDILAIDKKGNLVVVELKRDSYAGYADLQSIRYAAMVSTMTLDKLSFYFEKYLHQYEKDVDNVDAVQIINDFVELDDFVELSNSPRIILCSENFSQEITSTVLWLNDNGLDISCVRIVPHVVNNSIVIVPTRIIPLEEAESYMVSIKEKREESKSTLERKKKRKPTMNTLLDSGRLSAGDIIHMNNHLPEYVEFDQNDNRFKAMITGKHRRSQSVKWMHDNNEYSLSRLTRRIFSELHPEKEDIGSVHGSIYWTDDTNICLYDIAVSIQDEQD